MTKTDEDDDTAAAPKKKKPKLLLIAGVAGLLLGGAAFYAVTAGLLDGLIPGGGAQDDGHVAGTAGSDAAASARQAADSGHDAGAAAPGSSAFVMLDPLVISLGPDSRSKHLKVTLAIDAAPGRGPEIQHAMPRVVDILQGFLRAVDEREFEIPQSMDRLRAQMLRRVQLVTPTGAVQDLLIQEFVLN